MWKDSHYQKIVMSYSVMNLVSGLRGHYLPLEHESNLLRNILKFLLINGLGLYMYNFPRAPILPHYCLLKWVCGAAVYRICWKSCRLVFQLPLLLPKQTHMWSSVWHSCGASFLYCCEIINIFDVLKCIYDQGWPALKKMK